MAAVTDEDLRARSSLIIAKTCYYRDVNAVSGEPMPLFDDLRVSVQLRYLDLAEHILCELEEYIG